MVSSSKLFAKSKAGPDFQPYAVSVTSTQQKAKFHQLWMACHFYPLALHACFSDSMLSEKPCVVYELKHRKMVVLSLNKKADAVGIKQGMSVDHANALTADLQAKKQNTDKEKELLNELAERLCDFSDWVSIGDDNTLLIEIGRSLRLFNGLESLTEKLKEHVPFAMSISVTPSVSASVLLARHQCHVVVQNDVDIKTVLRDFPVELLDLDKKLSVRLQQSGMRKISDIWRMPKDGLARRFGKKLIDYLDRLTGDVPALPSHYISPPQFSKFVEFDYESANVSVIGRYLQRLFDALEIFMTKHDCVTQKVECWFHYHDHENTLISLALQLPTKQSRYWCEVANIHLEYYELAAPVCGLTLNCFDFSPWVPINQDLFGGHNSQIQSMQWQQLLTRLYARVGKNHVSRLGINHDFRPEKAFLRNVPDSTNLPPHIQKRPLWLLKQPKPLNGRLTYKVLCERIQTGWWDGQEICRDYYFAGDWQGRRLWVFKDLSTATWFVHGYFA